MLNDRGEDAPEEGARASHEGLEWGDATRRACREFLALCLSMERDSFGAGARWKEFKEEVAVMAAVESINKHSCGGVG